MADPMFDQAVIDGYVEAGWWGTDPLAKVVAGQRLDPARTPPPMSSSARAGTE